ncbi:hypothetical protein Slin14017_G043790 [Septoria linicola]|nr:hypothetical protein Slin14017_G043790 [Septoria linicola]
MTAAVFHGELIASSAATESSVESAMKTMSSPIVGASNWNYLRIELRKQGINVSELWSWYTVTLPADQVARSLSSLRIASRNKRAEDFRDWSGDGLSSAFNRLGVRLSSQISRSVEETRSIALPSESNILFKSSLGPPASETTENAITKLSSDLRNFHIAPNRPTHTRPATSALLSLPPELRNQIYQHALVSPTPMSINNSNIFRLPALLSTNKQIHRETFSMWYRQNTFHLDLLRPITTNVSAFTAAANRTGLVTLIFEGGIEPASSRALKISLYRQGDHGMTTDSRNRMLEAVHQMVDMMEWLVESGKELGMDEEEVEADMEDFWEMVMAALYRENGWELNRGGGTQVTTL